MERYDYVIIGGGIAGVSAAEAIRERDPSGTIAIISDEPHLLYSRVLLPSLLKKKIARERIFLRARGYFEKKRITLLLGEEAVSVNADAKEVALAGSARLTGKKLLLAAGGRPRDWGAAEWQKYLYRLHTLNDADRLERDMPRIRKPAVIGSSFIALEFLDIFAERGLQPLLLSPDPHFFSSILDKEGGGMLADGFARRGIVCRFNDSPAEAAEKKNMLVGTTRAGIPFQADALAVGIGIRRSVGFLDGSGIILGETGIVTDEFLETNIPGVYAAGDIAESYDVATKTRHTRGNWTNAVLQGKIAGTNMAGGHAAFAAIPAYSITALGMRIAAIGACDGAHETIVRMDAARASYARFFVRDGVIAGAALINSSDQRPHIMEMIRQKTPIEEYRRRLADPAFDIRAIPLIK